MKYTIIEFLKREIHTCTTSIDVRLKRKKQLEDYEYGVNYFDSRHTHEIEVELRGINNDLEVYTYRKFYYEKILEDYQYKGGKNE